MTASWSTIDCDVHVNVPSLQANLDMGVRYKMMKPFDVKSMIWNP